MTKYFGLLAVCWMGVGVASTHHFDDFFNHLESFSADFTQDTYNQNGDLISSASGDLLLSRPKQLKWHTTAPNEQILLLNNNELWLVDVELEQASLQTIQDLSKTPLYWLINKPNNAADKPVFSHHHEGIDWYQNKVSARSLAFGFARNQLKAISLENALEQTIFIVFSNAVVNPSISQEVFEPNFDPAFDVIR